MKLANLKGLRIFNYFKSKQKTSVSVPDKIWQDPLYFIAFGFGSGAIPIAPGTFGTLFAIPFYLTFASLALPYYLLLLIIFIIFSSWLCAQLSKTIRVHDHPGMNIDEFIGFFVTMTALPATPLYIALGFLFFRLFDILKPWPINYVDKQMTSGFGMIFDDVLAGIYSCFILHVLAVIL